MFCPKCSCENSDNAVYCVQCGAKLPQFMSESQTVRRHTPINERLHVIEDAVSHVKDGSWELKKFISFMQDLHAVLRSKEQEIRDIVIPEEATFEFQEELAVGFSGIALYNKGIEAMLTYNGRDNGQVLEQGLEYVRKGNERINEAMRINLATRSRLETEIAQNSSATI
ncbi:zinc ribbon domain-containing protein [bacterium]|nr:zinc ribbon domain-containing protein [bacterium]